MYLLEGNLSVCAYTVNSNHFHEDESGKNEDIKE
jgi:hypothetical protein